MSKIKKRLRLPKNVVRDEIVPLSDELYTSTAEHDELVAADFEENRQKYIEVEMYGVPVLVKVKLL